MEKEEIIKAVITFLFGSVLGVVFKYFYDYKGMVHKELWGKRYQEYQTLFSMTGILPQYLQPAIITAGELLKVSEEMRDWYFNTGGLLLSTKIRNKYFKVQKIIQAFIKCKPANYKIENEYETIRLLFSQLRSQLTDDLMSRNRI